MITKELATIPFFDGDSGGDAVAIVRQCGDRVALAISIQDNGDLEVLIDLNTAQKLVEALNSGIERINQNLSEDG